MYLHFENIYVYHRLYSTSMIRKVNVHMYVNMYITKLKTGGDFC